MDDIELQRLVEEISLAEFGKPFRHKAYFNSRLKTTGGQQENVNRSEFIYQATKMYLRERKKRQIRESMRRGYMEMAKINLTIASEAFQAEFEAEHTVERLVSGG